MPTPLQASFQSWLTRFDTLCLAYGGVRDSKWGEHSFLIETPLYGQLRASVHESDYDGQKKRGLVSIYMRFSDPLRAYHSIPAPWGEFNKFSGKWNIHIVGPDLTQVRHMAIHELMRRLEFCGVKLNQTKQ